jgi:hypothetical protein
VGSDSLDGFAISDAGIFDIHISELCWEMKSNDGHRDNRVGGHDWKTRGRGSLIFVS